MYRKVFKCYRIWKKHISQGTAERRAAAVMASMGAKANYDQNRRIARLPLTGKFVYTLGLKAKLEIRIFDSVKFLISTRATNG
jgi:hypothetical protein